MLIPGLNTWESWAAVIAAAVIYHLDGYWKHNSKHFDLPNYDVFTPDHFGEKTVELEDN